MESNTSHERLIAEIRSLFASNDYPGDDNLTVYDPAGCQYDETYNLLRGKTWQEFPVPEFMSGDTPIPDLTAQAFHYYLPSLLIFSIAEQSNLAVRIAQGLEFYLCPSNARTEGEFGYDDTERFCLRIALLTTPQKKIVAKVLREYVARGWCSEKEIKQSIDFLLTGEVGS